MNRDWSIFVNGCAKWNISVNRTQLEQLEAYFDLLSVRNRQMNLTSITQFDEAQILHFLDSLALCAFADPFTGSAVRLIDVGSGAGFPGMVLKILFPLWDVTLLDALQKRVLFLREVSDALHLSGVHVVHGRAEDLATDPEHRECYDVACARAVSALRVLAEYLLPFVKTGGCAVAYKTQDDGTEMREAGEAARLLGGGDLSFTDYHLPGTDVRRRLIRMKKEHGTPETYPRRAGIPEKRPL